MTASMTIPQIAHEDLHLIKLHKIKPINTAIIRHKYSSNLCGMYPYTNTISTEITPATKVPTMRCLPYSIDFLGVGCIVRIAAMPA